MFCALPRIEVMSSGTLGLPWMTPLRAQHKRFPIVWEHHLESLGFTWKYYKTRGGEFESKRSLVLGILPSLVWPCCRSLEQHANPAGAGDHGQNPRHEGCMGRPGRQKDEEQRVFFLFCFPCQLKESFIHHRSTNTCSHYHNFAENFAKGASWRM